MKYLKRYNELLLLPIGLLLWFISPALFHQLDETAATYDYGVFQKIIFGLIVFSFCSFNAWIALRITFPSVFQYLTDFFDTDFKRLTNEQKCVKLKLSLALFALYLLGLLLAMQTL
jgi:hypothetical protein